MNERVLVVEDIDDIYEVVDRYLQREGFVTERAADGESGLSMAMRGDYALVILDVMLPKLDGLEVCRQLRVRKPDIPLLMLTAKGEVFDRVLGLESGADDYLAKPFSPRELVARVKALLRRAAIRPKEAIAGKQLQRGELLIDLGKRNATLKGRVIEFSPIEFDLLVYLASNSGVAITREQLVQGVWQTEIADYEHTINTYINRMRSKIEENPKKPRFLLTVWGRGYRFATDEEIARSMEDSQSP